MVYKIIGGRRMEEPEVRELIEKRQVGPLDGFISNKTRNRFSALLKLALVEETKKDVTDQKVENRIRFRRQGGHCHVDGVFGPIRKPALISAKSAVVIFCANTKATAGNKRSAWAGSCARNQFRPNKPSKW